MLQKYLNISLLSATTVTLIALQWKPWAWIIYAIAVLQLVLCKRAYAKDALLIYIALGILGITPITTATDIPHMIGMGAALVLAIAIPYIISTYIYKDHAIRFRWHHGRAWMKREVLYIVVTAAISYFLLPFYLAHTGAYQNWSVTLGSLEITKLFIGTNALGIWDELFFVSTVLGLLRKHLRFPVANTVQAVLFTSFLYELGFTGWAPIMIFPFALLQGMIFRKTDSLFYIITIHLVIDFVLFLALINAHHPSVLAIFIT